MPTPWSMLKELLLVVDQDKLVELPKEMIGGKLIKELIVGAGATLPLRLMVPAVLSKYRELSPSVTVKGLPVTGLPLTVTV